MLDILNGFSLVTGVPPIEDTVDLLVKIGGQPLAGAMAASLLDVSIQQQLGQATHLRLRLAGSDSDTEQLAGVDDELFRPGNSVEVELGYLNQRRLVFWGEIVGLELEASTTERAVMTVDAYDLLHRLGRGQREDKYENKTYAAIVREIAQDLYQIAVDAVDDPVFDPENAIVYQQNISDLAFLTDKAQEIGYELFADPGRKKLVFRKSRVGEVPTLTLDATHDLVQFAARLDAAGQLGGVRVSALDSDTKTRISVSLDNPDALDRSYGFPKSRSLIVNLGLTTQKQATARANAELVRIRANYLTASGSCFGRAELRPGLMVEIVGVGMRFDGAYYVTTATHTLSPTEGYRTSFGLEGKPK